jgi:Flp pilus assembly protein TadG
MPSRCYPSSTNSRNSECGQVAMMFMAVFMVLVALAGLVVDGGIMLVYYRIGRTTVDGSAYAAATEMDRREFLTEQNDVVLNVSRACATAYDYAAQNGHGRVSISCYAQGNRATVNGQATAPTLFLRVFGITGVPFHFSSTAEFKYGITQEGQ